VDGCQGIQDRDINVREKNFLERDVEMVEVFRISDRLKAPG
jgi:hypothetical protein